MLIQRFVVDCFWCSFTWYSEIFFSFDKMVFVSCRFTLRTPAIPRKDRNLPNVIISETKDTTITKHQVWQKRHDASLLIDLDKSSCLIFDIRIISFGEINVKCKIFFYVAR